MKHHPCRLVTSQAELTLQRSARAYQWSSGRQPRTKPSEGVLCCEGLFLPSAIPGADNERTASVPALSIREHSRSCTVDTRNRPATGRQPDTLGMPPRWRTVPGIRASSSGMLDAARPYTTPWGLLKQPDKQKTSRRLPVQVPFEAGRLYRFAVLSKRTLQTRPAQLDFLQAPFRSRCNKLRWEGPNGNRARPSPM